MSSVMDNAPDTLGIVLSRDFEDNVPRVRDVDIGERMGMAQPRDIRRTIEKYADDLRDFGQLVRLRAQRAQTPLGPLGYDHWLNKDQAVFIAGRSDTELGRKMYKLLVKAFGQYEALLVEASRKVPPLLAEDFRPWTKTWRDDLMVELCKLRGEVFSGKHPRWAAWINSIVYECVLGKEAYAELKARNPNPSRGHNHHQLIRPELIERLKQLEFIGKIAGISASLDDFVAKLRTVYQQQPFQLPLLAVHS